MAIGSEVTARKASLRRELLRRRRDRPPAARAAAADAVAAALLDGLAPLGRVGTVAAHVPDVTEPGAGRLPGALAATGARVMLPVVPPEGVDLAWAEFTGELAPGRFGLQEPVGPRLAACALAAADVVVVPALAVDRSGVRLGRGKGYYDRALAHARQDAVLVAVVFDDEFVDRLPAEPHDRPVGAVVTPSGGWQPLDAARGGAH